MEKKVDFSLLYPDGAGAETFRLDSEVLKDLETDILFDFIMETEGPGKSRPECVRNMFLNFSGDENTIRYRQDISECLLEFPWMMKAFEQLLSTIDELDSYRTVKVKAQDILYKVIFRIMELEKYIICVDSLKNAYERTEAETGREDLTSAGLEYIRKYIMNVYSDKNFLHLKENLPELAAKVRKVKSVNIGVNMSESLIPMEAALISINEKPFTGKSPGVFNRLFKAGDSGTDDGGMRGFTPLRPHYGSGFSPDNDPLFKALLEDLSSVMEDVCEPILKALNRYIQINTLFFILLKDEIAFYIYFSRFVLKMKSMGLPVCKPEICPAGQRIIEIEDSFNINLFIRMMEKNNYGNPAESLVTNSVKLNDGGRIIILTGPNQGGKTVYTQSIGLSILFFQAGLYIPGSKASISPADNIFTHFQTDETIKNDMGRFADEAKRLNGIVCKATPQSLILMNESFASTNYTESLYIARDIMCIFRMLGLRAVFSTHLHDLALQAEEINSSVMGESRVISMVSQVEESGEPGKPVKRTFKIIASPPAGKSYAKETALKYGIGFNQLSDLLSKRGVIPGIKA